MVQKDWQHFWSAGTQVQSLAQPCRKRPEEKELRQGVDWEAGGGELRGGRETANEG